MDYLFLVCSALVWLVFILIVKIEINALDRKYEIEREKAFKEASANYEKLKLEYELAALNGDK